MNLQKQNLIPKMAIEISSWQVGKTSTEMYESVHKKGILIPS